MNILSILFLLQSGTPQQPSGAGWSMWIMLILVFLVMYLFMIRPQRKQQKELEAFRSELKKGDKVITAGGIYGVVDEVAERYIMIRIDKETKMKVDKSSIMRDSSDVQQQQQQTK